MNYFIYLVFEKMCPGIITREARYLYTCSSEGMQGMALTGSAQKGTESSELQTTVKN